MRFLSFSVILVFLVSCTNVQPIEKDFRGIKDPRERWEAYQLSNYRITQQKACECLPPHEWTAFIRNGAVENVTYEGKESEETKERVSNQAITIDEAFDIIEEHKNTAHSVSVEYHPKYGYPIELFVDIHEMIADEEIIYRFKDLKENG